MQFRNERPQGRRPRDDRSHLRPIAATFLIMWHKFNGFNHVPGKKILEIARK
jgi:hypothetical protein